MGKLKNLYKDAPTLPLDESSLQGIQERDKARKVEELIEKTRARERGIRKEILFRQAIQEHDGPPQLRAGLLALTLFLGFGAGVCTLAAVLHSGLPGVIEVSNLVGFAVRPNLILIFMASLSGITLVRSRVKGAHLKRRDLQTDSALSPKLIEALRWAQFNLSLALVASFMGWEVILTHLVSAKFSVIMLFLCGTAAWWTLGWML